MPRVIKSILASNRTRILFAAAATTLLPSLAMARSHAPQRDDNFSDRARIEQRDRVDQRDYDRRDNDRRDYDRHDYDRHDDSYRGDDRVWVEPVYRTVCDQRWVEPVYRDVCDRVWCPPIVQQVHERVWVGDKYEWLPNSTHGGTVGVTKVLVKCGHWEDRCRDVIVKEGHFDEVRRQELVCAGHYESVERQECVTPGHWEACDRRASTNDSRDNFAIDLSFIFR